jgi:AcrR family transcriptional regulator
VPNFTKQAIVNTFLELLNEKPFAKITVTDIVNRCGINRNTFYYYYQDMFALVDELLKMDMQKILSHHDLRSSWTEGFLEATTLVRQNKTAFYHLYDSVNRERLEEYLFDLSRTTVSNFINDQAEGRNISQEDLNNLTLLYTVCIDGIILQWLHDGMKQSPEAFLAEMAPILDGITDELLKRAEAKNA